MRVISDNGPFRLLAYKHPRRACAARVTKLGLRESWGAPRRGERGKGRGGKMEKRKEGRRRSKCKFGRKILYIHEWAKRY